MKDTLILSGGGLLGLASLGALHELFEVFPQRNIKRIAGSSVGALIGALLCVATPESLYNFFQNYNLFDDENIDFSDFFSDMGFIKHAMIKDAVCNYISTDCTFSDYFAKTDIHLVIVGSNLTKAKAVYFDYKNTPSMNVIDALCISISIPFVFPKIVHEDCIFSDGCVTDHFPWNYFKTPEKHKLGITLQSVCASHDNNDMFYFVHCLVNTLLSNQKQTQINSVLSLKIDYPVIKEYTIEDLHYLFTFGKSCAKQWIKKNN